jgi:hypothetical protein
MYTDITRRLGALVHTLAKSEPGPTPAPDGTSINGCFHTQPVRQIRVPDLNLTSWAPGPTAGFSVSTCTRV